MAIRLTTAIDSGIRALSRRFRLGPVPIEASPAQSQPVSQKMDRTIHEIGGRSAASASGVPPSAPATLSHPATQAASAGARRCESANPASAPDLLALIRITVSRRHPASSTAAAIATALSSTAPLSAEAIIRYVIPR